MQPKQYLRACVTVVLAVAATAAGAQVRLCSQVPAAEREFVRSIGACRDTPAPVIDVAPGSPATGPLVVVPVPTVVGLTFDAARARLTGFDLRRSYRASSEPGGTVLAQEPAPPARVAAGAPVTVVLSDGSLRPPPRVAESEVDGLRRAPAETTTAAPAVSNTPQAALPQGQDAPAATEAVRRTPQTSSASANTAVVPRKVAPAQQPSSRTRADRVDGPRAARSASVTETIEVPNVVGRSDADASRQLIEFRVDRIEVVANAAPSGHVLAQDPAPGTPVAPGSSIGLQISDGSLAAAAPSATSTSSANVAVPTSAPSTPPATESSTPPTASAAAQDPRSTLPPPGSSALILLALVLVGLVLGALLMRRRVLARTQAVEDENVALLGGVPVQVTAAATEEPAGLQPIAPVAHENAAGVTEAKAAEAKAAEAIATPALAATTIATSTTPPLMVSAMPLPEIRVIARVESGQTTIEFAAPSEAEEAALEQSRELHE